MTVKELITYLQVIAPTAGNKPVRARDERGAFSDCLDLCHDPDCFIIDAWPEHSFESLDDDKDCPGLCNGDFNE